MVVPANPPLGTTKCCVCAETLPIPATKIARVNMAVFIKRWILKDNLLEDWRLFLLVQGIILVIIKNLILM